jgi:hypothetical protein
MRGTSFLGTGP